MQMDPPTVGAPVATRPRVGGVGASDRFTVDSHHGESDGRCSSLRHAHPSRAGISACSPGESSPSGASLSESDRGNLTDRPRRRQDRVGPGDLCGFITGPPAEVGDQCRAVWVHHPIMAYRAVELRTGTVATDSLPFHG